MTAGVSGVVLAGGRSSRFGSDKLAARYGDLPLLDRAVGAIARQSAEVIVVVAPSDERALPSASVPVRRAVDPEPFGGPLVGLLAGLEAAREPIVLVAGGDMPTMSDAVLGALVRALVSAEESAQAAVLVQRGVAQPLPAAVRNGAATQVARALIADGERSLVALVARLPTRRVEEIEWRSLDPEGETLRDIDRPGDIPPR
ncbi:MAG TPA: molybdenum cofactor guanylyltransferase [Candidatus Limnocylindrales bacterium]|jgi:molybdopterin-guanine dinucleotide biosynthesis protein A|nr:molybdenum cofactor guanylyltransferase [Candidatus Limnocylindrales bacterium]